MIYQELIVYLIVLLCSICVIRRLCGFFRKKDRKTTGCAAGCAGCIKASQRKCADLTAKKQPDVLHIRKKNVPLQRR